MTTIDKCFKIILAGDRESSRQAARQIRKLVYGSGESGGYKSIASIIKNAANEYKKITEDWRQENFAVAVSVMYFLHDKENKPDFLFPWLFHLLQHPNGNVRHAAVRMIGHELGPLTVHLRFPNEKSSYLRELSPEQSDMILFSLFANLNDLAADLWKPSYKKYKYISSLPNGPYKSVQMLLSEMEEDCGREYYDRLHDSLRKSRIMEDRGQLISRFKENGILEQTAFSLVQSKLKRMREELEKEMLPDIKERYPQFNFRETVAKVYEGDLPIPELIKLIDNSINLDEHSVEQRNAFLNFISMIWNIYPHKELEGYSPHEIAAMHEIMQQKTGL